MKRPFTDVGNNKPFAGRINPDTDDYYYTDLLKLTLNSPAKDSLKLSHIVALYSSYVDQGTHPVRATEMLMKHFDLFDEEEKRIWIEAQSGHIKSVQLLVLACPDIITIPFVQKALIKILSSHKKLFTQKFQMRDPQARENPSDIEREKQERSENTASLAAELSLQWRDFLSPRNKLPWGKKQLKYLVDVACREFGLNRGDAIIKVSGDLGIGESALAKMVPESGKIGRPKKKPLA